MHNFTKFLFLIVIFNFLSCQSPQKKTTISVFKYIVPQASYVIKINKKKVIRQTNPIVTATYLNQADKDFLAKLNFKLPYIINILQNNSKIKGFVAAGKPDNFKANFIHKNGEYESLPVYEEKFHQQNYFATQLNGIILVSNRRLLLENAIRDKNLLGQLYQKPSFVKGIKSLDENADFNLIVLTPNLKPDVYFNSALKIKWTAIGHWYFYDMVESQQPIATGLCLSPGNAGILNKVFENIGSVKENFAQLLPYAIDESILVTFDDFEKFSKQLSRLKLYAPISPIINKQKLNSLKAICYFHENNNRAYMLYLTDPSSLIGEEPKKIREFNNYDIFKFESGDLINAQFQGILPQVKPEFFSVVEGKLILTETQAYLEKILNDYANHSTLGHSQTYRSLQNEIPDDYHLVLFKNKTKIGQQVFMKALTFKVDNQLCFSNLVLQKNKGDDSQGLIEQVMTYPMPQRPTSSPQLVFNHKSKAYNIIYQDDQNQLNLVNFKGRTLWQVPLKNKISGSITPVDLYRNQKIQYAFITPHKWYILDRLGRNVDNFPIKFKTEITGGLKVFDYDHNRKYRFGIVQGKFLNLYDNNGKKIKGFNFKAKAAIDKLPQHFRIGSKDFIAVQDRQGQLYLLNRRGQIRIKTNQKFNTKRNDWGVYQKKFVNIDDDNNIISIDLSGNIKKAKLNLGKNILSEIKDNTLAAIAGNKLLINKKTQDLDLGTYGKPHIYKTPGQTYILIANRDNNKIYGFNKKGVPLKNFPIIGQEILDFKYDQTGKYLLVLDSANNLLVYKL